LLPTGKRTRSFILLCLALHAANASREPML